MVTRTKVNAAGDGDTYEIKLDGETLYLPRVTTIISDVMSQGKSGMAYWGGRLATEFFATMFDSVTDEEDEDEWYAAWKSSEWSPQGQLKVAQDRGKQAHHLFEKLLTREATLLEEGGVLYAEVDGFRHVPVSYDLAVCKAYRDVFSDIEGLLSEQRVYSVEHGFAGTADLIAGSVIGDLKTHKPPARFSDMVQTAAYSLAWEEMTGQHIDHHMVVMAGEDGEYVIAHGFVEPSVFLAVKQVWHAMKAWEGKA